MGVTVKEEFQKVKVNQLFPIELNLSPPYLREIFLNNVYRRSLSLITLWTPQGERPARGTSGGVMKVAVSASGYEEYETLQGTGTDNFNEINMLRNENRPSRWDILVEGNDAIVHFRNATDTGWLAEIILPVGFHSIDITSLAIQIKNRNVGSNTNFQVIAFY